MFVRPARQEDSVIFSEWFLGMPSFRQDLFRLPETYTLCAFKPGKIVGFMVVEFSKDFQILSRFVSNPKASDLEKACASSLLVKNVITIGFLNNIPEIAFMGDHPGTNRISEHAFSTNETYDGFPVYRLKLKDLDCPTPQQ